MSKIKVVDGTPLPPMILISLDNFSLLGLTRT
jgi:hypothetical protein